MKPFESHLLLSIVVFVVLVVFLGRPQWEPQSRLPSTLYRSRTIARRLRFLHLKDTSLTLRRHTLNPNLPNLVSQGPSPLDWTRVYICTHRRMIVCRSRFQWRCTSTRCSISKTGTQRVWCDVSNEPWSDGIHHTADICAHTQGNQEKEHTPLVELVSVAEGVWRLRLAQHPNSLVLYHDNR